MLSPGRCALQHLNRGAARSSVARSIGFADHSAKGPTMNLHKPHLAVFLIAVALAVCALIGFFVTAPVLSQYQFWLALSAFVLLALGCIY
jgi:hypothetical protein